MDLGSRNELIIPLFNVDHFDGLSGHTNAHSFFRLVFQPDAHAVMLKFGLQSIGFKPLLAFAFELEHECATVNAVFGNECFYVSFIQIIHRSFFTPVKHAARAENRRDEECGKKMLMFAHNVNVISFPKSNESE